MTPTQAQTLLKYQPETGEFKWKTLGKGRSHMPFRGTPLRIRGTSPAPWDGVESGELVYIGDTPCVLKPDPSKDIYNGLSIRIEGRSYLAHHLAWMIMTGESCRVYHINGDKTDNRWSNLTDDKTRTLTYVRGAKPQSPPTPYHARSGDPLDKAKAESAKMHYVQSYLEYDEKLGRFRWTNKNRMEWTYGTPVKANGSRMLYFRIDGAKVSIPAHMAAVMLKTYTRPSRVTHIDGDLANNKWENLSYE